MPVRKKAPEDLTAKKALALEVIDRLKKEYPDAGCTLDYDHAWQLLVSVRLAAQCTDARVNIVVEDCLPNIPMLLRWLLQNPKTLKPSSSPAGWDTPKRGISPPVCGCCAINTVVRCPPPLRSCSPCPA